MVNTNVIEGLSLRDVFAVEIAKQIAGRGMSKEDTKQALACSYELADAALKGRNHGQNI